ncbi:glycosyltransferase [Bacillus sp. V3]|nr:glycosyltransferase [Bacillus sp. V3]
MKIEKPLISLITVSYNSERTIKDTIESILNQTYDHIEYIIVDGFSKDNTVEIVKSYETKMNERGFKYKIISEKDKGLYDAMNKGLNMAEGKIIGILNSDDYYINELVIEKVVNRMISKKADCLYGDLLYVDQTDTTNIVRKWRVKNGNFRLGWNPPHPTTFLTNSIYEKVGQYKIDYKISSDYDLLYRAIYKEKCRVEYLPEYIVKMRTGGKSTSGIKSKIVGSKEVYTTLKEHKQKFKISIVLLRLLLKLKQFV